ncbi:putative iron transport multicopper oxidase precursor [Myxozyma melibiosi]|uniref:Iron transport multicopper oxidase n=1 Tax=Myxozyma melibiosi TaxID=54550 RepID=A0ABR1F3H1_9ASCO
MRLSTILLGAATAAASVAAKTVQYDWVVSTVTANPDDLYERDVVGVNGAWPPPPIVVEKGDRLIVNMTNKLDQPASIHFHGMYQNGTNEMDGPVFVTQCPVPSGSNFIYNFTVDQVGSYWYHSHYKAQYVNGFRGPLIVKDPDEPWDYDEDVYLTLSDWYHDDAFYLVKNEFLTLRNPTGAEPIPDAGLMNDTQNVKWKVEPNTTYKLRIINIGGFVSQYIWFEGHDFEIVEVDGIYVENQKASMLYVTVAQRYTILLTTKNTTDENFPFMISFDLNMLDNLPDTLQYNTTGWLTYDEDADFPDAAVIDEFDFYDDFYLVPLEKEEPWEADTTITATVIMDNLGDGANYAFFSNETYVAPKVPTLMTVMSAPENESTNAWIYGSNTNAHVLEYGDVVEIVLNNGDTGTHPFHLHGHAFQVIERSNASDSDDDFITYDASNPGIINEYPMRRDTLYLRPNGYFVIRFKANNPGVWFFHCHIEWHLEQGLAMTLIEAPTEIRERITIPDDHWAACKAGGYSYEGNAAANTENYFDLTGEAVQPDPLPAGFTARGIVAMVFSCVSAFLGMGFITWYGMSELKTTEHEVAQVMGEIPLDDESGESK